MSKVIARTAIKQFTKLPFQIRKKEGTNKIYSFNGFRSYALRSTLCNIPDGHL